MPDLGRSFLIAVYGARPSFDPAAGELMALVEVVAGSDQVLVDRERNRCRIEGTPGSRDRDKWCSPIGLILAARRGVWGLSIVEDHYSPGFDRPLVFERSGRSPDRLGRAPREVIPNRDWSRRARLPDDLCSCLRCRDLVIARRRRRGGYFAELHAPGRHWYRALRWFGELLTGCQGPGAANVEHGRDCPAFRLEDAGPIRRGRRSRGSLLAQLLRGLRVDPVGSRWLKGGAR